jgi:hypothetical protein
MMADKISVADLLARNIAIDWFEAVSLVREVCSVLAAERVLESTPELAQVLLGANGKITVTGTAHDDAPVRRLGQLLQALLRTTEPPVTLRLVLSEAMAAPPVYEAISDFDAALAYFERPDRYPVLKSLYERASAAEANAPVVTSVQDLDAIAPLPAAHAETKKRQRPATNRRATLLVGMAAVLVTVAAIGYQRGMLGGNGSFKTVSARASAAVDNAVVSTMSAVTEMAGMGKLVTPATVSADANVVVPPSPSSSRKRSAHSAPLVLAGVPVKVFDLQPASDAEPAVGPAGTASSAVLEASTKALSVDQRVYGPDDHDVVAPQAIRPHLPTALPDGVSPTQLARIELVVSADGAVESVKLRPGRAPVSVTEAMLLSAAKAWRFSPAVKGGESVRYRKTVFLSEH